MLSVDFLESSIVIALVGYFIAFAFQLYMMYLNIKQSRVNNQMAELLSEVKAIRKELAAHKKTVVKKKKKK